MDEGRECLRQEHRGLIRRMSAWQVMRGVVEARPCSRTLVNFICQAENLLTMSIKLVWV